MPFQPTPHLVVEKDGPVAVVTLNNPDELNAFLPAMHMGMREIWWDLAVDASVRAVVLTGAGRAFSAGGNIPNFIKMVDDANHRSAELRGARQIMDAMCEFNKPLIAAVNGPAVGLGCSVAVSCDLVYIAESAYLADTHVSIGLVCGDGGAVMFPLMMSLLKAKEYLLTGDRIPAADAVALGLANRMVPDDQLMTEALAMAHRLAKQPPQAIQETKRALNLHFQRAIALVAPFALAAESESFSTDELRATVEKFKQK